MKSYPLAAMASLLVVLFLRVPSAPAEELKLTLSSALEMAVDKSHFVRSADLEVDKAGVAVKRARAERYVPEAELLVETGVVPAARGTVLDSPD